MISLISDDQLLKNPEAAAIISEFTENPFSLDLTLYHFDPDPPPPELPPPHEDPPLLPDELKLLPEELLLC